MIERFLIEVLRDPNALRTTCLKCGAAIRLYSSPGTTERSSWIGTGLYDHQCSQAFGVFALAHEHWREVVRDCFLNGRDAEAIEIICYELNLVPP